MNFLFKNVEKIGNFKMEVPNDMRYSIVNNDYYEKNVIFWLEKISRSLSEPVFYDIGTNFGYYSITLAEYCNKIYSFEPVKKTFKVFEKNIKRNKIKNVSAFKIGLSDTNEKKEINLYNSSGNNSIFKRNIPKDHGLKLIGKEVLNLKTLDDFIVKNKAEKPGIIKIDVEGAELNVLKGAMKTIRESLPILMIEYGETTSNDAGYNREEMINEIMKYGNYQFWGLADDVNDCELIKYEDFNKNNVANILALPYTFKLQ